MADQDIPNVDREISLLPEDIRADMAERGRNDLYYFSKAIMGFHEVVPHTHGSLCVFLDRHPARFKMVLMPRGHFKTSVATISRVTQKAVADPNQRILLVNEVADNARNFLSSIEQHFESNRVLRALYSSVIPKDVRKVPWNAQEMRLNREVRVPENTIEAMGIESALTSKHFTHITFDDVISEDAAISQATMEAAITRTSRVTSLMVNPNNNTADLIGTRWALHDVYSAWKARYGDKMGVFVRAAIKDGLPIFPELISLDTLAQVRKDLGEYMFSCNPEEAPVLMADWTSKPIAEIRVGDVVVGFEFPDGPEKMRTVPTRVLAIGSRVAKVFKITMMSGRVIRCTEDHHWMCDISHRKDRPHLLYRPAKIGQQMHYVCDPSIPEPNPEANMGWLAGMFDGEGSVGGKLTSGSGAHLVIAQSKAVNRPIYDEIGRQLDLLGLKYDTRDDMYVFGTSREDRRRFLNWCWPFVKSDRVWTSLFGARAITEQDTPIAIEPDGEETVYSFQTETGNYVCWGYASRNCLYMNNPRDVANQDFNIQDIRFWRWSSDEEHVVLYGRDGEIVREWPIEKLDITTTVDLAVAEKITSDCNSIVTVGVSPMGEAIVLDSWTRRCTPLEVIEHLFWVKTRWAVRAFGIEGVVYQKAFKYFLRAECERRGVYMNIVELKQLPSKRSTGNNSKETRIRGLQPIAATGRLYILPTQHELRNELADFPLGEHDDTIDALSMQLQLWRGFLSPARMAKYKASEQALIHRVRAGMVSELDLGMHFDRPRKGADIPHPDDLGIEIPQFSDFQEVSMEDYRG